MSSLMILDISRSSETFWNEHTNFRLFDTGVNIAWFLYVDFLRKVYEKISSFDPKFLGEIAVHAP